MNVINLVVLDNEDLAWTGVYCNGRLVIEQYLPNSCDTRILKAVGFEVEIKYLSPRWLNEQPDSKMPELLSEIPDEALTLVQ